MARLALAPWEPWQDQSGSQLKPWNSTPLPDMLKILIISDPLVWDLREMTWWNDIEMTSILLGKKRGLKKIWISLYWAKSILTTRILRQWSHGSQRSAVQDESVSPRTNIESSSDKYYIILHILYLLMSNSIKCSYFFKFGLFHWCCDFPAPHGHQEHLLQRSDYWPSPPRGRRRTYWRLKDHLNYFHVNTRKGKKWCANSPDRLIAAFQDAKCAKDSKDSNASMVLANLQLIKWHPD